ncbi:unnamed protein product [Allacma fusca]|uniref:F5/8 type C domain-containing protein n=1 Tax=Allacma fusca TaxID=39272 RepID=A0A8J2P7E5_9HEXA|nr:unnamed protein product [Allacma fusca]
MICLLIRIRNEQNGGAWCPRSVIEDGVKEYLEIDFGEEYRVTQTETQGRFGNGRGLEFAQQFQLEYYREVLGRWILYKDHFGRTIFDANQNTYLSVHQKLTPPIIATRVRFIPYSVHPRTVCMRVESYGCHFTEGVIHYDCPQGYWKKNPDVDLRDSSYDGWMDENGILQGGLGLLVDSVLGPNDFRVPHTNKVTWNLGGTGIAVEFPIAVSPVESAFKVQSALYIMWWEDVAIK